MGTNTTNTACNTLLSGPHIALKFQAELRVLAEILYYATTSIIGRQTPGEEYCDIVQVRHNRIPSLQARVLLVVLHVVAPYLVLKASKRADTWYHKSSWKSSTLHKLYEVFQQLPLATLVEMMQKTHLAMFYFSGTFYTIAHRILDIRYVSHL